MDQHPEQNRRIGLASRPEGAPTGKDFRLEKTARPECSQPLSSGSGSGFGHRKYTSTGADYRLVESAR